MENLKVMYSSCLSNYHFMNGSLFDRRSAFCICANFLKTHNPPPILLKMFIPTIPTVCIYKPNFSYCTLLSLLPGELVLKCVTKWHNFLVLTSQICAPSPPLCLYACLSLHPLHTYIHMCKHTRTRTRTHTHTHVHMHKCVTVSFFQNSTVFISLSGYTYYYLVLRLSGKMLVLWTVVHFLEVPKLKIQ